MMAMDDPWRYSSCEIPVSSARQPYPADISCNTHATPRLHHALPPPPPHSSSSSSCTPHAVVAKVFLIYWFLSSKVPETIFDRVWFPVNAAKLRAWASTEWMHEWTNDVFIWIAFFASLLVLWFSHCSSDGPTNVRPFLRSGSGYNWLSSGFLQFTTHLSL